MIRSFKDKVAEAIFDGKCPKGFPADLFKSARRKLEAVHAAMGLDDLRSPPGNRLEALSGDRAGQHSIRKTTSGAYASTGRMAVRKVWKSWTTIERSEGRNAHDR